MINRKLAGNYIALFKKENIDGVEVPSWEIISAPTDEDVIRLFKPFLQQECKTMFQHIEESQRRFKLTPEIEPHIGDTFVAPISASIPAVPVSFPGNSELIDLCDALKLFPNREGKVFNPFTRQLCSISDLVPRKDVVNIVSNRALTLTAPAQFIHQLFQLQQANNADNKRLVSSVTDILTTLKPNHYQAILEYINSNNVNKDSQEFNRFITLLKLQLFSLITQGKPLNSCNPEEIKVFFAELKKLDVASQVDLMVDQWKNLDVIIEWLKNNSAEVMPCFSNEEAYLSFLNALKIRQATDELEARYGIRSEEVKIEKGNMVFSFSDSTYQTLLREYENKESALPLEYKKVNDQWQAVLTIEEYKGIVKDNKTNVETLSGNLVNYQSHLTDSESSRFKKTILIQSQLKTKKDKIKELQAALADSKDEPRTNAVRLIAFRNALPNAAVGIKFPAR